jgi:hypothetical protein
LSLPAGVQTICRMESEVAERRVLARAAVTIGGTDRLARRLNLAPRQVADYLSGATPIPDALFLQAIDILLAELPDPKRPPRQPELRPRPPEG